LRLFAKLDLSQEKLHSIKSRGHDVFVTQDLCRGDKSCSAQDLTPAEEEQTIREVINVLQGQQKTNQTRLIVVANRCPNQAKWCAHKDAVFKAFLNMHLLLSYIVN